MSPEYVESIALMKHSNTINQSTDPKLQSKGSMKSQKIPVLYRKQHPKIVVVNKPIKT
jgi:hypothetical protein